MQAGWNRAVSVWRARARAGQVAAAPSTLATAPREPAFPWVCALVLGVCLWLALRYAPALGFYSPDSALKWLQLKSLRFEAGALRTGLDYFGRSFDPQLRSIPLGESFFAVREGEIELVWPPWFALMSWPFQWVFGASGMRMLPALSACACGLFSARIAVRLAGARTRTSALVIAVLASPVIVYGMLAWEHAISSALACWGVWSWLAPPRAAWRTALAGAVLALACAMRAEIWVLCAALLTAALCTGREERRAGVALGFALGCATLPFALWAVLHTEHALPANAARNFSHASLDYLRKTGADVLAVFSWGSADTLTWVGVGSTLTLVVASALDRRALAAHGGAAPRKLAHLHGLSLGAYALIAGLLVGRRLFEHGDTLHGLLESAPWLLLALAPGPGASAGRAARLLWLSMLAYVLFYLLSITLFSWAGPNGGREWGPRFILPVFPLAAPLLVLRWRQGLTSAPWLRRAHQGSVLLCVSLAFALHVKGLSVVQRAERMQANLAQQLSLMPEGTLFVALEWWIPTLLASQFERRATFWVQDPVAWNEIVSRAACAGKGDVWLAGMELPEPESLRAFTVPQLELEQHSEIALDGLVLRSLSASPRSAELCDYLSTHAVPYPPEAGRKSPLPR